MLVDLIYSNGIFRSGHVQICKINGDKASGEVCEEDDAIYARFPIETYENHFLPTRKMGGKTK